MMIAVLGINHEALGDADLDDEGDDDGLGLELGVDEGLALGLSELLDDDDGLELLEDEGLAERLDDGERLALGLELVSGSSAFGRIFRVTSSICVTYLPETVSRITQS